MTGSAKLRLWHNVGSNANLFMSQILALNSVLSSLGVENQFPMVKGETKISSFTLHEQHLTMIWLRRDFSNTQFYFEVWEI